MRCIPTSFFGTTTWAAPVLGLIGAAFILTCGLAYLETARRAALRREEGYGAGHRNEPGPVDATKLPGPLVAILPLVTVAVVNFALTRFIPHAYPASVAAVLPGQAASVRVELKSAAVLVVIAVYYATGLV